MGSVVVGKRHYDGALAVQSTPHYRTTFGDNRVKLPDVSVTYSVAPERGVKRCVATCKGYPLLRLTIQGMK